MVAARRESTGIRQVVVAPITHAEPRQDQLPLEIPSSVCRQLGLDNQRHWLRSDELNIFAWPGYDLRQLPDAGGSYDYGMLPLELFERFRQIVVERRKARKARLVPRD